MTSPLVPLASNDVLGCPAWDDKLQSHLSETTQDRVAPHQSSSGNCTTQHSERSSIVHDIKSDATQQVLDTTSGAELYPTIGT